MGYRLYPSGKALLYAAPAWLTGSILWFMSRIPSFRQLLATGVNECRALVDVLVTSAGQLDPPAPSDTRIQAMTP